jgi:putative Ca2+/H+ antiporter (TMEM165/GDT1 family)
MLQAMLSSFGVVAISEMGDKTQLLAFSLAARFKRPWPILAGIFVATVLNHALASSLGSWVSAQFAPHTLAWVLALTFFGFGVWTLKPDTLDENDAQHRYGPFLTTTVLFFLAEMGDKTQLATVALAAKFHSLVAVTLGTTLGMMVSDGLAVLLGEKLAEHSQSRWIRIAAACVFFVFAALSAFRAMGV